MFRAKLNSGGCSCGCAATEDVALESENQEQFLNACAWFFFIKRANSSPYYRKVRVGSYANKSVEEAKQLTELACGRADGVAVIRDELDQLTEKLAGAFIPPFRALPEYQTGLTGEQLIVNASKKQEYEARHRLWQTTLERRTEDFEQFRTNFFRCRVPDPQDDDEGA